MVYVALLFMCDIGEEKVFRNPCKPLHKSRSVSNSGKTKAVFEFFLKWLMV
jgi:hypothetical protein